MTTVSSGFREALRKAANAATKDGSKERGVLLSIGTRLNGAGTELYDVAGDAEVLEFAGGEFVEAIGQEAARELVTAAAAIRAADANDTEDAEEEDAPGAAI